MKKINLSGRERTVLRGIDFATGTTGAELIVRTRLAPEDLVDVLNALMEAGYAEMAPYAEATTLDQFQDATFEVNPSYAQDLREAIARR
ncbi:MAG: hypothetical protein M3463_05485 [Verrucomicrobiota bacterium]|nr:hypothetical protein [Verrucomicrobiota bacterium]